MMTTKDDTIVLVSFGDCYHKPRYSDDPPPLRSVMGTVCGYDAVMDNLIMSKKHLGFKKPCRRCYKAGEGRGI